MTGGPEKMKKEKTAVLQVEDFHPDHTFDCGQAFRWEREEDGSYTGIASGRIVNVRIEPLPGRSGAARDPKPEKRPEADRGSGETSGEPELRDGVPALLTVSNTTQEEFEYFWKEYFDLNRDYGAVKKRLAEKDPVLKAAVKYAWGLRILNQGPWETILSFLISQNNHIPRIRKCIEALCAGFGEEAGSYRGRTYYKVPSPERLAALGEADLATCRLGYRAGYVIRTARQVAERGIEESFEYLTSLCGVGPKVANCILLFSMRQGSRFPLDVWVKRILTRYYGIPEKDTGAMESFAASYFGKDGGIAQQYLFHYERNEGRRKGENR